ncbi:hypothetical protein ACFTZG_30960, partial [Streptomyces albidoflavus]
MGSETADPETAPPPGPRPRPGGRTARTRRQVLDAVLAELGEHGYDGVDPGEDQVGGGAGAQVVLES